MGGDVGVQLLFEPAMPLSLVAPGDVLFELAHVAKDIPFIATSPLRTGYSLLKGIPVATMSNCGCQCPKTPDPQDPNHS